MLDAVGQSHDSEPLEQPQHLGDNCDLRKASTKYTSNYMPRSQSDKLVTNPTRTSERRWSLVESVRRLVNLDRTRTNDKDARTTIYLSKDSSYAEEIALEAGTRERPSNRRCCGQGRFRSKTYKTILAIPILALTVL